MTINVIWKKALVISIIVMFIAVGVYPAIATYHKLSPEILLEKENIFGKDTEPKEYLFQTIIDILNNPEVKILFETTKNDGKCISFNYDVRIVFQKLLFSKPLLIFSIIFSKPSLTRSYLDTNYVRGCELTNILGKDDVNSMVESIKITDTEFFNNLNNIIFDNEDLYDKISLLAEINTPVDNTTDICSILHILLLTYLIRAGITNFIGKFFEGSIISKIFDLLWFKNWELAGVCLFIYDFLDCDLNDS